MKWIGGRQSSNVEDQRGRSGRGGSGGGFNPMLLGPLIGSFFQKPDYSSSEYFWLFHLLPAIIR